MITFLISISVLFLGYAIYSQYVERVFGADAQRKTPATTMADGVDYISLPWWRVFLIQFLNIAGLGPIFGAIAGAMWGPVAYIWIVAGAIFAGAVHDYFSGMLSIKHKGLSITEIVGVYMGRFTKQFMRAFTVFLMVMVGTVFILGPAKILSGMTTGYASMTFWIVVVFAYYVIATMLPVDKIIGRIYPVFGIALLFMALSLIGALMWQGFQIPELSLNNMGNFHNDSENFPIFPMLFITIACGAISGFHATQSPLMARCVGNEKLGRRVFYGAMITEAVVAMIWATIAMSFFGGIGQLNEVMVEQNGNAAWVVHEVANSLLGKFGAILALLGVVAAPITSGDTAFRSARLIISDFLNLKQGPVRNRLIISIPLFVAGFLLAQINFDVIWRYFAWSNQTLATIVLWTITIYLLTSNKNFWITLLPALFMTMVISTYIFLAPEGLSLSKTLSYSLGGVITILSAVAFGLYYRKTKQEFT
ncbi:MAG: carbon starvation protein A [Bacteroidales bacterium]